MTEHWDCGAVNHSRFAAFPPSSFDEDPAAHKFHLPVAALGIAGYALILVLALADRLWLTLQAAEIGFALAAFLSYLEAFVIEKWRASTACGRRASLRRSCWRRSWR